MADERSSENFLRRWSQRKLAAARDAETRVEEGPAADRTDTRDRVAAPSAVAPVAATASEPQAPLAPRVSPPLPDPATLTFDSDFKAFLAPDVDETTRRAALRKLFSDPRFNVQDGLDVYIDDYSKFVPMPEGLAAKLAHARYLFDPPKTRINEQGHVEDVVEEVPGAAEVPETLADTEVPAPLSPPRGPHDPQVQPTGTAVAPEGSDVTPDALAASEHTPTGVASKRERLS